jgi:hypothetical protein
MMVYLTGFSINCVAVLAAFAYFCYISRKNKDDQPPLLAKPVLILTALQTLISIYFACKGDLTTASIIVWLLAVPLILTSLFILLIIIFNPDWK